MVALIFLLTASLHFDRIYTVSVSLLGACSAGLLAWFRPKYSGPLMLALVVQYIPFLLVNGILTYLPVVIYGSDAITGFRIGSIPIEDFIYSFVMLVCPVCIYEYLGSRRRA
jgi:lycopene cyclase domain-containing protein